MTTPSYRVYIDWDSDGGLYLGDFESDTDGWDPAATGSAPTVARSTTRAYHGAASLLVTWSTGTSQLVQPDPMGTFVIGRSYTLSAWVWVPSAGGQHVKWTVAGVSSGSASSTTNAWVQITHTFTATATTHSLQITASTSPSGGEQTWIDLARIVGPGEDLMATPPGVISDVTIEYGRDQARSLQPVSPGEAEFEVDNDERVYSPEYASSPLHGLLGPGRDVLIEATYDGTLYTQFDGSIDGFELTSGMGNRFAKFSAIDGLARMKNLPVSTALYPSVRTGEAVHHILDAVGWTRARDIDAGGTTIRWWWAESGDAYQELLDIVAAEGPDAFVTIGSTGEFIFRDRHHRLLRAASLTSQATFKDDGVSGGEVEFDPPCSINYGWRDVINQVEVTVDDRTPSPQPVSIWTDATAYSLSSGVSRQFEVKSDNPFWSLQAPTQGAPSTVLTSDPDFVLSGSVSVAFSRTSGQSTIMTVTATSATTVFSMRLRAHSVSTNTSSSKVAKEDAASVALVGPKSHTPNATWVGIEDANAIADLILGKRATRLPVVEFTVPNGTSEQVVQQLSRDLSDRVTVVDSESGFDADCFIEHIKHVIRDDGNTHETTFSAEKIPEVPTNLFRFDVAGKGFNDGLFAASGIDDPDTIFTFDVAGHGFNDGMFAT